MRNYLRVVAISVVALAAYLVLIHSFHLMNQASDRSLYSGIAETLGVILFVRVIVRAIWRVL